MANNSLKYFLFSLAWLSTNTHSFAQNLVPNPSFETYTTCPISYSVGEPLQCTPWQTANGATPDYFNACSNPSEVGVPGNFAGYQWPVTGDAYAGVALKWNNGQWREYLQVQLTEPMLAGYSYSLSFYMSLADLYCGISNIGIYFSTTPPPVTGNITGPLYVTPQFESDLGLLNDTQNWMLIDGCYAAQGGEQWITIGNFYDDANSPIDPVCSLTVNSYYYVDDVSITLGDLTNVLELELGDPVTACGFYEIDPGVTGVEYHWEDGSTEPSLIVTESGFYALTITSGCQTGIDSIEVFFDGVPESVDLGPLYVTICNGENYIISLDPESGDYLWQDGSIEPFYSINTPGIYMVTLDDGCDVTMDEITVFVMDVPDPFSLGDDTYLCEGDEIEFSFDPSLGDFEWQDNSMSPYYLILYGGIYELTISNMCGEYSDEIFVQEILPPFIDLGPDQLQLCEGEFIDIEFNPDLGDYLWQDGSTTSTYSISVPNVYSVTVTNECGMSNDSMEVVLVSEPVFDLGQDILICSAQLPITLDVSGTSNATSFVWQDSSTNSQIQVTNSGTYSVTVSNACFSVLDSVDVIIQNINPVVALPPDQSLCPGQTLMLDGSTVAGNYLWQDSSTSSTLLVSQEGSYSLTVTNQCGSGSDSITVDYIDSLEAPNLGPDVSLCPGESFTFYADVTGVSYTWQDSSTADSLVVMLPGIYSLQVADMCNVTSDTVVVIINDNPPVVDLPASIDLCAADTVIIDAGISGVQYQWNDGSQLPSITVSDPGLYSITVSNACGVDADTVLIVDAGPAPAVSLPSDLAICPGEFVLLSPSSTDVLTWLWQDGSTGSTYNVSVPGLVTIQVGNNCGVSVDTILVSLLSSIPALVLGADTSLCPGEILTFSINIPGVDILWPDGSSGLDYNVTTATVVYATISNQCGSSSDSVNVILLPPSPVLDLGIDLSLCPGETINLSPGISGVEYLWQNGSTSSFLSVTMPGLIMLTVTNDCGTDMDTIEIIEDTTGPEVQLGEDVQACEGEIVTLSADILGVNYLWQDGSTMADISTSVSGTFILQVSNACGTDSDTVIVDISGHVPTPSLGPDTLLCEGFTFQLQSNADAETSILWHDGSDLPLLNVYSPGIYTLSETSHCGSGADTINVTYLSPPDLFELGPDTMLCPGEFILLLAPTTTDLITWQDGSHGISMIADLEQTYSLQVSNRCGIESDELSLTIDDRIPLIQIDQVIPLCGDEIVTLDATQPFDAGYLWSTGGTLSTIQVITPGLYDVNVTTPCHSLRQEVEVIPGEDCNHDVYIPSIFSPNHDQVNDVFTISLGSKLDVVSMSCSVFDRWGNLVFNSSEINFAWDGNFRNSELGPGVYLYLIIMEYNIATEVQSQVYLGDLTLIR